MEKPSCYECQFRRNVPDSAHSQCVHPTVADKQLLAVVGMVPNAIEVVGNGHGVRKGWFYWPFRFDPVWLESCSGFADKNVPDTPALPSASNRSRRTR